MGIKISLIQLLFCSQFEYLYGQKSYVDTIPQKKYIMDLDVEAKIEPCAVMTVSLVSKLLITPTTIDLTFV